jgi:hypothetical protein
LPKLPRQYPGKHHQWVRHPFTRQFRNPSENKNEDEHGEERTQYGPKEFRSRFACNEQAHRATRENKRARDNETNRASNCARCVQASMMISDSAVILGSSSPGHSAIDFVKHFAQSVAEFPTRIMFLKLADITDPPDVVADAVLLLVLPS